MALQVFHVFDSHLNDLGLFNAATAFLQVRGGDESGQVGQTIVHPIPTTFLDDPVRHGILKKNGILTYEADSCGSRIAPAITRERTTTKFEILDSNVTCVAVEVSFDRPD